MNRTMVEMLNENEKSLGVFNNVNIQYVSVNSFIEGVDDKQTW